MLRASRSDIRWSACAACRAPRCLSAFPLASGPPTIAGDRGNSALPVPQHGSGRVCAVRVQPGAGAGRAAPGGAAWESKVRQGRQTGEQLREVALESWILILDPAEMSSSRQGHHNVSAVKAGRVRRPQLELVDFITAWVGRAYFCSHYFFAPVAFFFFFFFFFFSRVCYE